MHVSHSLHLFREESVGCFGHSPLPSLHVFVMSSLESRSGMKPGGMNGIFYSSSTSSASNGRY